MSKDLMESAPHDANVLAAFLEKRLDEGERARFVAHLSECRECRATASAYARAAAQDPQTGTSHSQTFTLSDARVWTSLAAMVVLGTIAAVVGLRLNAPAPTAPPSATAPAAAPTQPAAPTIGPPVAPPEGAPAPPRTSGGTGASSDVLRRRGGERKIGDKSFRLVAGQWVDEAYDPAVGLPVVAAESADERRALLARLPALRPYAALGDRVIVVHQGAVYRFGPPDGL